MIFRRPSCPVWIQTADYESGAVALGMVLSARGLKIRQEELCEECFVARDGSRLENLAGAATAHGLTVESRTGLSPEELETLPFPSVIGWREEGRFVTCVGRKGGSWIVHDPAKGRCRLDAASFAEDFTGVALGVSGKPKQESDAVGNPFAMFLVCCRGNLLLLLFIGLLLLPVDLAQPNMNRFLMDYFLVSEYVHWGPPILMLGLLLLVLTGFGNWLWYQAKLSLNLRITVIHSTGLMKTLFSLPVTFFKARLPGDLAGRVDSIKDIACFFSGSLVGNLLGLVAVVGFGALLVAYDTLLGTFALLIAAIIIGVLLKSQAKLGLRAAVVQRQHARMVAISTNGISMMETIKASGQEDGFFTDWSGLYCREQKAYMDQMRFSQIVNAVPFAAQNIGLTAIVGLGALRILNGDLSSGAYVAFQLVLGCFLAPLSSIVDSFVALQDTRANIERILDVIRHPAALRAAEEVAARKPVPVADVRKLQGIVELRDVTFGYNRNDPPLLEHFNLRIVAGERVAIVGLSGSGKSTVAKLISGTYEPWSGEVLFDGRPRSDYSEDELRYSFAMVDQEVVMFPGSVLDNLTMYDDSIPFGSITQAAKDAMVHDSIIGRPGGYYALFNAQGTNFSGGERQRIEIARALAVEPSILLLDEATSALDPATEVQFDLNLRRRGVTTIVIAHRLSTIRDADRIVVLKRGRIVEMGTHDELIKLSGIYSELVSA